ncbi:MAG: hypothetical protein Q9181_007634 [Wetmoreana brouardii]
MANAEDKTTLLRTVFSLSIVLSLVIVGLRLVARRIKHQHLWWDDYLTLAALVGTILMFIFQHYTLQYGAGTHTRPDWPPERLRNFLIWTFASECNYAWIITCVKASVLCLYLRIFGIDKTFANVVRCCLVIVVAWGLATLLCAILQCIPTHAAWDLSIPRDRCFNYRAYLIATNVPNIGLDFVVILLSVHKVRTIKISTPKKIGLIGVFALSTFASIVSIVRVTANASFQNVDPTYNYVAVMIWSTVEANVGVICACLPILAPLVRLCFGRHDRSQDRSARGSLPSARVVNRWRPGHHHRDPSLEHLNREDTPASTYRDSSNSTGIQGSAVRGEGDSALELSALPVVSVIDLENKGKI